MPRYTQQQYQALTRAMALGATNVRYADGRSVTYASREAMAALAAEMEAELGLRPPRTTIAKAAWTRD